MKVNALGFILCFLACNPVVAQDDAGWHNSIYLEFGGPANVASINLEHYSIEKERFKMGARFGLGASRFLDFTNQWKPDFYVPIGLTSDILLYQKQKSRFSLVLGGGINIASVVQVDAELEPQRIRSLNGYFQGGVTYMISEKWVLRGSYTPILTNNIGLAHWGALSFGTTF